MIEKNVQVGSKYLGIFREGRQEAHIDNIPDSSMHLFFSSVSSLVLSGLDWCTTLSYVPTEDQTAENLLSIMLPLLWPQEISSWNPS